MNGEAENRLALPGSLAGKLRVSPCDFIVTGGGGWIGQAALEMLESALGDDIERRISVFGSSDRMLRLRSGRGLPCRALEHISALGGGAKFFIHCAFLTKDRLLDQSVENFVAGNEKISGLVAAAIEKSDVRGLFVPSSGAVYRKSYLSSRVGQPPTQPSPQGGRAFYGAFPNNGAQSEISEMQTQVDVSAAISPPPLGGGLGGGSADFLDDDIGKNAYGVMKIRDEKRFGEIAAKKNMPFCMPRLFNLSGPFINKLDSYALASMIKAMLAGKPISIRAAHRVVRSYIHVGDLLTLAFAMLLEPRADDEPIFDTAGDEALEMGDLAQRVRAALGCPEIAIERPQRIEGNDDIYVGDREAMQRMMRSRNLALRAIDDQVRDTAVFMQTSSALPTV